MVGSFLLATVSFFGVGLGAILRIYFSMVKEVNEITKSQKMLGNDYGVGTDSASIKIIDDRKE